MSKHSDNDRQVKTIYIVTHGEKEDSPNPGLTEKGFQQVQNLLEFLPKKFTSIIVGTGLRHLQTAQALGISIEKISDFSPIIGNEISLKITAGKAHFLLANGTWIKVNQFKFFEEAKPSLMKIINSLPDGSLICAGKKAMYMLHVDDPKDGYIYIIQCDGKGICAWRGYDE